MWLATKWLAEYCRLARHDGRRREGDEMFVILPFFLAFGFCAGYVWSTRRGLRPYFDGNWSRIFAACLTVAAVGIFLVDLLNAFLLASGPRGEMMAVAGFVVGAASGQWFSRAESERDKLILVAVSGVFLAAAALEYDIGIFDSLTKFGAGSVSIEFSDHGARSATGKSAATTPTGGSSSSSPFPGANRLKGTISDLQTLGQAILRDEQYSRFFAGLDPALEGGEALQATMNSYTFKFTKYACNQIKRFADRLAVIQDYHKGETSSLTINPELISTLRLSYTRALQLEDPNIWARSGDRSANRLAAMMKESSDNVAEEFNALPDDSKAGLKDFTETPQVCDRVPAGAPAFDKLDDRQKAEAYGYLGYFAVTVALAEYAGGNREDAIQLVDREIRRQIQEQESSSAATPALNCDTAEARASCLDQLRLDQFRRLLVLSRLESTEDNLISRSEDQPADPIRISLLIRMVDDMGRVFAHLDKKEQTDESLFLGQFYEDPSASCEQSMAKGAEEKQLLARFAFARINAENNAVWAAAENPEIVEAEPLLISTLDRYAQHISTFDVKCMSAMGFALDPDANVRSRLLDTAAAYWEAKGNRFGAETGNNEHLREIESDPSVTIRALCDAKKAYAFARKTSIKPQKPTTYDDRVLNLDERLLKYHASAYTVGLLSGWARTNQALKKYPVGDVEKACHE
jgi:hypothetical protein